MQISIILYFISAILMIIGASALVFRLRLKKVLREQKQEIEETLPEYLLKPKVFYANIPNETPKTVVTPYRYVTINGVEPEAPVSFFHTKKGYFCIFLIVGLPTLIGVWIIFFAH